MRDSFNPLSHERVINEIISAISEKGNEDRHYLIRGLSGSGKSHLAGSIAQRWREKDNGNRTIYLSGDIGHSDRPFYPFLSNVNPVVKKSVRDIVVGGSVELAKGIPYAGDLVGYLIDTISNNKSRKRKESVHYLSDIEQRLLIDLEKNATTGKTMLIADNIHWWDAAALNLLFLLIDRILDDEYPNFEGITIIGVYTDEQEVVSQRQINRLLEDKRFLHHAISQIDETNFLKAIQLFGYSGNLSGEIVHILFSITGGHLLLVKKLAEYLDSSPDNLKINYHLTNFNDERWRITFIEDLLSYRLKTLGVQYAQVIELLEIASIIGISFSYQELLCISKEDERKYIEIIDKASQSTLIVGTQNQRSFAHDFIREFFLSRLNNKKALYSKQFSECLTILRPSDYFTRAKHVLDSGNIEDSLALYIVGYLKNLRDGHVADQAIVSRMNHLLPDSNLTELFQSLKSAYEYFFKGDFKLAISTLNSIEDIYSKKLIAEKYYLLSLCLSRPMENHLFKEAIKCLEGWESLKTEESEIWLRIMSTKLIMHAHLSDFDSAKSIEKIIMLYLSERVKYDPSANENINILRRKSGSIHVTEIASERTKKSVEFFSAKDANGILKSPVQSYMASTNHSGNLICLGDYEEAFSYAKVTIDTITQNPSIVFPKHFIPSNNYILSGLLSKLFSPKQALKMYENLTDSIEGQGDHLLVQTNVAVVYALNNELETAHSILSHIFAKSVKSIELDLYYQYYIKSNLAAIKLLRGERDIARNLWDALNSKIPSIPEFHFLKRRHQLLSESFISSEINDPVVWQSHLLKQYPMELGKAWAFLGQGFLFSDLQFWSES